MGQADGGVPPAATLHPATTVTKWITWTVLLRPSLACACSHTHTGAQTGQHSPRRRRPFVQSNSAPLALRQARQHLLEFGQCPSGLVNERLARSWSRSMAAGLAPDARVRPPDPVSNGSLRRALSASHVLLAHSRPIMEYVFDQVRHSQSVVVLADPRGMLMHTLGDEHFADKAARGLVVRCLLARRASRHQRHWHCAGRGRRRADPWLRAFPGAQRFPNLRRLAHCVGHGRDAGHSGYFQ